MNMPDKPARLNLLVPSTYLNLILRTLEPGLAQRVLADLDLPVDGAEGLQGTVTLGQLQAVVIKLRALLGEDWHLQLIHRLNLFAHGSLGVAVATAPDMDAALSVLERYIMIRVPFIRLERRIDEHRCVLCVVEEVELGETWRDLLETVVLGIQSLLEQVRGSPLREAQIGFAFPPPQYMHALERQIQGRAMFGAPEHSISLPCSWLQRSGPMYEPAMHQAALSRVEAEFEGLASRISVTCLVERALLAEPENVPGLSEIARSQHIAPRTLIRKLKREGSSYQQILQRVRQRRAIELLSNTSLTVKQVSYLLGYKDPSNFGRAFAQWMGQSPGAFRKGADRS